MNASQAANYADLSADPADMRWIVVKDIFLVSIDSTLLTLDTLSCVFGALDVNWTQY